MRFDFCHTLRLRDHFEVLITSWCVSKHANVLSVVSAMQMCIYDSIIFKIIEILLKEFSIILLNINGKYKVIKNNICSFYGK